MPEGLNGLPGTAFSQLLGDARNKFQLLIMCSELHFAVLCGQLLKLLSRVLSTVSNVQVQWLASCKVHEHLSLLDSAWGAT